MVRLRGRTPRGVRLVGEVPLGAWETIAFVAALRHNKMMAPMVVKGATNGEMFLADVEQCLVPKLRRGHIVVMDNLQAHKVAGIQEAIEAAGATLRYSRNIRPTSTRSNCLVAHSKRSRVRLPRGLSRLSSGLSAHSCRCSVPENALTILGMQVLPPYERNCSVSAPTR